MTGPSIPLFGAFVTGWRVPLFVAGLCLVAWAACQAGIRWITRDRGHYLCGTDASGQTATSYCTCGQTFTGMTADSAIASWAKHRRQEVGHR